ncbi:hypothetical protein [Brachyspira pulli]|uniref:hypothetical protein n=1 Tax=Brachyspira pulli TaxID=310721 RepID=UPI0030041C28
MIFTDENGKIYEIPEEKYSEFKVSDARAREILEHVKKEVDSNISKNDSDVKGYNNMLAFAGTLDANGKLNTGSVLLVGEKPYRVSDTGWNLLV